MLVVEDFVARAAATVAAVLRLEQFEVVVLVKRKSCHPEKEEDSIAIVVVIVVVTQRLNKVPDLVKKTIGVLEINHHWCKLFCH